MSPRRPGCWWRGAGQAAAGAAAARVLQPAAAEAARHVRVRQHAAAAARLLRPRPRRVPGAAVTPATGLQVTIEISAISAISAHPYQAPGSCSRLTWSPRPPSPPPRCPSST